MILTVTLNSAIDKVLLIDELTPGLPMQAHGVITSVGGKGLDASVSLRHLGVETVGLTFMAGECGEQLTGLLQGYGIEPAVVLVGGETRMIYVLAERHTGRVSHIKHGELEVTPAHIAQLVERYKALMPRSAWVICSGSLPPAVSAGLYGDLARCAREANVPFLIDAKQAAIHATLPYHPTIVKMNWEEFEWTFEVTASDLGKLIREALAVYTQCGLISLVITCAAKGILAVTPQGGYFATAPVQPVVNAAGAGDAVSAALAWRLSLSEPWEDALRWAAAAAAATVLTERTADCRPSDVQAILPTVKVRRLDF